MNRTTAFLAIILLAVVGVAGAVVVILLRPDATATFGSILTFVLVTAIAAGPTYFAVSKTNEKLEAQEHKINTITAQTNGNLSRRDDEIRKLHRILHANGIDPDKEEVSA